MHPLVQGFWTKGVQMRWFVVSGVLALIAAAYALYYAEFDPLAIGLFVYGSLMLLLYTYPLKYFALGELTIFLIWGPIMIGGRVTWCWPMSGAGTWRLPASPSGSARQASISASTSTSRGRTGRKGVHTLPVLVGQTAARVITIASIVLAYAVTLYLIAVPRFFTPVLLVVFFAAPQGAEALRRLWLPRPDEAPPGYTVWPRWFSTVAFVHNRWFGNLFILGVALDTALRLIFPSFWRF